MVRLALQNNKKYKLNVLVRKVFGAFFMRADVIAPHFGVIFMFSDPKLIRFEWLIGYYTLK